MSEPPKRARQPNLLFLTSHDSGRYFGCYGKKTVHTPHLDRLATEGVCFEQCFACVPIGSASRASMLTGRYPQRHGLLHHKGWGFSLNPQERLLSHYLRDAGYHTALCGVHQMGHGAAKDYGFARSLPCGEGDSRTIAKEVRHFLGTRKNAREPFYLQIGFTETHTPFDAFGVPPDTENGVEVPGYLANDPANRKQMAGLQGALRHLDESVGEILAALEETGLAEETLVVFNTDHGIEMPRSKWTLHGAGLEIALLARLPGGPVSGGKRTPYLMSNVDILPTVMEWLGLPIPAGLDGRSYAGAFDGRGAAPPRTEVFGYYYETSSRSVRTPRYNLIRHFNTCADYQYLPVSYENILVRKRMPSLWFFDLPSDPWELVNLSQRPEYNAIVHDLSGRLWNWLEQTGDEILHHPPVPPWWQEARREHEAHQRSRGNEGRNG